MLTVNVRQIRLLAEDVKGFGPNTAINLLDSANEDDPALEMRVLDKTGEEIAGDFIWPDGRTGY
jgi:hypothetical protein